MSCKESPVVFETLSKESANFRNPYNYDNEIFQPGRFFSYKYSFIKDQEEEFLIRVLDDENEIWDLVKPSEADENTIYRINMEIREGRSPFDKYNSDYNQTVFKYSYVNLDGVEIYNEITGLVENDENIWVHPPRSFLFGILEFNAFPYIKFNKGVISWSSNIKVPQSWSNENWFTWEGILNNSTCFVKEELSSLQSSIETQTTNKFGVSSSKMIFNAKKGFTSLKYVNFDNSELHLKLIN